MKIAMEFVKREVAGESMLIPAGSTALKINGIITLNEVGARIWELLPDAADEAALVSALAKEYDAPEEELKNDVHSFSEELRTLGIIE